MSTLQCFVGIDVTNAQRDIALRPTGERWAVTNDEVAIVTYAHLRAAGKAAKVALTACMRKLLTISSSSPGDSG